MLMLTPIYNKSMHILLCSNISEVIFSPLSPSLELKCIFNILNNIYGIQTCAILLKLEIE